MSKGKGKRVEGEALERVNNMDVLAGSIDVLLDNFLEGVDEAQDRLGLDRADTLAVLGGFSKKLRKWMEEHHAMLDAGRRPERTDPTDAALLGAVMRQPGSGVGSFAATVGHQRVRDAKLPTVVLHQFGGGGREWESGNDSHLGVEQRPTWDELNAEVGKLRASNRLRGERAKRERARRMAAEYRLRSVHGMLSDGMDADDVLAYVAAVVRNVGNGVQRMGGATGDAP